MTSFNSVELNRLSRIRKGSTDVIMTKKGENCACVYIKNGLLKLFQHKQLPPINFATKTKRKIMEAHLMHRLLILNDWRSMGLK